MAVPSDILTGCLEYSKKSILSVGSGDGSQSASIVEQGFRNILTTFYDSRQQVLWKYPPAKEKLKVLDEQCRHRPKFGIGATKLETYNLGSFDLIMFTFPHTGVPNNSLDSRSSNRALLKRFLVSAQKLLKPGGEIQITLKRGQVYDDWNLSEIVKEKAIGLKYRSKHLFDKRQFPGYTHRLTSGMQGSLKKVPDKQGSIVHVFEPISGQSAETSASIVPFLGKLLTIVEPCSSSWTDEEVWEQVLSALELDRSRSRTVLELRKILHQPPPDTRQMNRVLYCMEEYGLLIRNPPDPNGKNQKPKWELSKKRKGTM